VGLLAEEASVLANESRGTSKGGDRCDEVEVNGLASTTADTTGGAAGRGDIAAMDDSCETADPKRIPGRCGIGMNSACWIASINMPRNASDPALTRVQLTSRKNDGSRESRLKNEFKRVYPWKLLYVLFG
jgi:hypothetical protein